MTVLRKGGSVVFECNTCGDELDTETDEWPEALARMKREGWSAEKVGKDWIHGCDKCGT